MPTRIDELSKQIQRLIGTANALMERYARLAEEFDSNRLANEEIRELLKEFIEEAGRWANGLSKRIDRLEEFIILAGMGKDRKAGEITQEVSGEHVERGLREQLTEQQKLLITYQRNLARVKQSIAETGYETIENANKVEDYQNKIDKISEAIERIRQALV